MILNCKNISPAMCVISLFCSPTGCSCTSLPQPMWSTREGAGKQVFYPWGRALLCHQTPAKNQSCQIPIIKSKLSKSYQIIKVDKFLQKNKIYQIPAKNQSCQIPAKKLMLSNSCKKISYHIPAKYQSCQIYVRNQSSQINVKKS